MLKIIPLVVLAAICFADTDELDVRLCPMVVGCGNAQLPALPVSRAPFERSAEVSRRPVALATFPFFARNSGAGPNYAQRSSRLPRLANRAMWTQPWRQKTALPTLNCRSERLKPEENQQDRKTLLT